MSGLAKMEIKILGDYRRQGEEGGVLSGRRDSSQAATHRDRLVLRSMLTRVFIELGLCCNKSSYQTSSLPS